MARRLVLALIGSLALGAGVASAQDDGDDRSILTKMGSALSFYGFLRVDTVYDTDQMNDTQTPIYVLSDDDPASGSSDFTIYTRLTRFGMDFAGGEVMNGHTLTGKLEIDFYGSPASDSRNEVRIRHAYLNLQKEQLSLLAGQTWDLYSPLYPSVNPDMLNWNAGNPGDRRPQIRVGYSPSVGDDSTLGLFGAIAMQGAIDGQEIDGGADGVLDGEDSGIPQFQARASYSTTLMTESKSEFGIWLSYGQEKTDGAPIGGEDDWTSTLYGIDVTLPITPELKLRGEAWAGENLDDLRGGIGQGINPTTGDEIASIGYWLELLYALSDTTDVFAGYSVDDPDDDDLTAGSSTNRDKNELIYAGAQYRVWDPIRLGWEWTFWSTEYVGASDGDNNRFRVWIAYHF